MGEFLGQTQEREDHEHDHHKSDEVNDAIHAHGSKLTEV